MHTVLRRLRHLPLPTSTRGLLHSSIKVPLLVYLYSLYRYTMINVYGERRRGAFGMPAKRPLSQISWRLRGRGRGWDRDTVTQRLAAWPFSARTENRRVSRHVTGTALPLAFFSSLLSLLSSSSPSSPSLLSGTCDSGRHIAVLAHALAVWEESTSCEKSNRFSVFR